MSFDHVKMVRGISGLSATQKLILFDLAGRADDFGRCWPSIPTIMRDTSIGKSQTVWTNLAILQTKGLVRIVKVEGRHNEYFLTLENGLEPGAEKDRVQNSTQCKIAPGVGAEKDRDQVLKGTPKIPLSIQEGTNTFVSSVGPDPKYPQNEEQNSEAPPEAKVDNCPYQEIVNLYHEILPTSPRVKLLGKARKLSIKARWNGEVVERLKALEKGTSREDRREFLKSFFEQAAACDILTGRKTFSNGGVYFVTLDKLMSPSGFVNLIEGKYDNRGAA